MGRKKTSILKSQFLAQEEISKNQDPHDPKIGDPPSFDYIFLQHLLRHEAKTTGFTQQTQNKTKFLEKH